MGEGWLCEGGWGGGRRLRLISTVILDVRQFCQKFMSKLRPLSLIYKAIVETFMFFINSWARLYFAVN